jgi:pseudouridine kinase
MDASVVIFGGAHVDHKAFAYERIRQGDKNPVRMTSSFGGVARNVAETLSCLEVKTALLSQVGCDSAGDLVLKHLTEHKVDTHLVKRSLTDKTASFTALLEPGGELFVAFSDMAIYDDMRFDYQKARAYKQARIWMVDANVNEEEMEKLAHACPHHVAIWALGTSSFKNERFKKIMEHIDVLLLNEKEANAFLSFKPKNLVMTAGKHGAQLVSENQSAWFSATATTIVDSVGAGDAFFAGLAYGFLDKGSLALAMPYAFACARLALKTSQTVSDSLSKEKLLEEMHLPFRARRAA